MRDEKANYIGFILFFLSIVLIVVVGSVTLYSVRNNEINKKKIVNDEVVVTDKLKKDKNKDFIYYSDREEINKDLNIYYTYPIINIDSSTANNLNNILKNNALEAKNNITKNEEGNIIEAKTYEYTNYIYQEYLSILVNKSLYKDEKTTLQEINSYTINLITGEEVTYEELLKEFGFTYTEVIDLIKENLEANQTYDGEVANIKIDETINLLKDNNTYNIYINENGKLTVKYIVKTNNIDYNDIIILK